MPQPNPYGPTSTTHLVMSVTIPPLPQMAPIAAVLCGLLTPSGKLCPAVYESLVEKMGGWSANPLGFHPPISQL
jgi:hypothetical protein